MLDFIQVQYLPLLIFLIRVVDMSLDTMRVLFIVRGRRAQAWAVGFMQSALWVIAVASVLGHLDNLFNVVAYAAGFATGNVVGMRIEERLAIGHSHLRVISPDRGEAIASAMRAAGYAVTELTGEGKDGPVAILTMSVLRRNLNIARSEILKTDPDAFVTLSDIRPLNRGFWRA